MSITAILTPSEAAKAAAREAAAEASAAPSTTDDFANYMDNSTSSDSLTAIFQKASETYGVPMSLLTAMAKQESCFQADATSKSGAMGIMQLMPATAESLGVTDAYDPKQNIMGGAKYISELLNQYDGNVSLALAAYNAGSNNVDKYGGIPPFTETQDYVAKITGYMSEGVTLPDGTTISADNSTSYSSANSSDSSNKINDLLTQIFSYSDYQKFISLFADGIQNALASAITGTASGTNNSNTANTVYNSAAPTADSASTTSADAVSNTSDTTSTAATSTSAVNGTLSVTVTSSNDTTPPDDAAMAVTDTAVAAQKTADTSKKDTTADSNLYYAYQSINYNNSVLNLLSQNSNDNV